MSTATAFDYASAAAPSRVKARTAEGRITANLHPGVLGVAIAGYAVLVSALVIGFMGPADIQVPFMIIVICLAAFIGLPAWMGASAAKFWRRHGGTDAPAGSFREFLAGRFENDSGRSSGIGALALVATVPLSLAFGAIAMAIVVNVVR
jgi:hypothetical protein